MKTPELTFETERLFIRPVQAGDKEDYMRLRVETSNIKKAYETMTDFTDEEWKAELSSEDSLSFCVFLKLDNTFAGTCSLQDYKTDTIELGMDIVKEYRNQGIGTELVTGLINTVHDSFPGKAIVLKTNSDNHACRAVAEKCGATFKGFKPSIAAKAMAKILELSKPEDLSPEKRAEGEALVDAGKES